MQIPPLSDILKNGFILYGDEKDILIALTPLYLLAGMAVPLWLTPLDNIPIESVHLMPYLSGLLSIGIGDTAASYIGSNFGSTKWPGMLSLLYFNILYLPHKSVPLHGFVLL